MMNAYADMPMMAVWYSRLSYDSMMKDIRSTPKLERLVTKEIKRAQNSTAEHVYNKIVTHQDGALRIVDEPPLLFHVDADLKEHGQAFLQRYSDTLREDYRMLFNRFRLVDAALKVVGVGSVGTRCYIVLLLDEHDAPLFLQIKEAGVSVLERHHGPSPWKQNGERVAARSISCHAVGAHRSHGLSGRGPNRERCRWRPASISGRRQHEIGTQKAPRCDRLRQRIVRRRKRLILLPAQR